ncbi:hypothetical protein JAAARDRAFT_37394 [Jaapia argillacea MUCL 33604]|uniref:Uncharacterized protein n=1 Tax=Jaapia argillacea MUCL 33604 TaxID=933084 RepID=A0A067PNK1_9AGAM|nr:hypothetical protein JAAARDRAFT_37394 [Jaapia argillacea MUCL 33604]
MNSNMLPSSQSSFQPSSSSQSTLYSMQGMQMPMSYSQSGFPNQSFVSQTLSSDSVLQGSDPNSPELFKQNIQLVQELVNRVNALATNALHGVENAYHPGTSPTQTSADIASLRQTLQHLITVMCRSGVGALPLLTPDQSMSIPDEEKMMADAQKAIQVLYERHKRTQESAGVVASLLGAVDPTSRR